MRHFLWLLLLPACFNPDDILVVSGSLSSPDPVAGQVVRLLRDPLANNGPGCAEAKLFKETTADEAGNFSFDVFRAQAMKLTGGGFFCFRVETSFPSGSTVFSDLQALTGADKLPPFPDWRAHPTRVDGVLRFEPLAPLPAEELLFEGDQLVHRAEWISEDGGLAWVMDDRVMAFLTGAGGIAPVRVPMVLDDYALEDFSGTVSLRGQLTIMEEGTGPFGSGATTLEARSGDTLQLTGGRVPLSRGLDCPGRGTPCPLTDGALTAVDAGMALPIVFTLAAPASLSAVVVRGAETDATLMAVQLIGVDGGSLPLVQHFFPTSLWNANAPVQTRRPQRDGGFEFAPAVEPRFASITFDAGVPIREVRVGFASALERLSELSIFE